VGAPSKYNASIHLTVIVPIGYDYDVELLERQVRLVDTAHPWVSHYVGGDQAPSINWMSSISMKEGEWIDRQYAVEIRPPFMLTRDQTHAYERYGEQLAKSLAEIVTKDVLRVSSTIKTSGSGESYHPRDL
jgi:hypothetical protein